MGRRADVHIDESAGSIQWNGGQTNYLIQANDGTLYQVFADSGSDVCYRKSVDGGLSWRSTVVVFAGTAVSMAVWYDRWSNIAAGLIHIAYTESGGSDTLYRTINTESSDALSTQTTIFAGTSAAVGGHISIARARGGNVYCKTVIDAGAEGGFFRLPNANVPNGAWDAARTIDEAVATNDAMILLPGFAADNQDMLAIFWDTSANEISRKIYDDSANTWAEASIATSMTKPTNATVSPPFGAAVDLTNSRIVMAAWTTVDAVNADLRCWTVTESAITETSTNVVLNSTDDQGHAVVSIDTATGYWTVIYAGASGGGETWLTAINLYCKGSNDDGATWGAETQLTLLAKTTQWIGTIPRRIGPVAVAYYDDGAVHNNVGVNVDRTTPGMGYGLGLT